MGIFYDIVYMIFGPCLQEVFCFFIVMLDKGAVNRVDLFDYIRLSVLALSEGVNVRPGSTPLLKCRVWIKDREN